MNSNMIKKMTVTTHSYERYIERVHKGSITSGTVDKANRWFKNALTSGKVLDIPDERGMTHYVYQGHTVVYEKLKNRVVTVKPYKPYYDESSGFLDIKNEMSTIVARKLGKNMKQLKHQHRQKLIALHTEEIKRLSVHNPNTQNIIAERVSEIKKEINKIEGKIQGVQLLAEQYGAEI